MMYNTTCTNSHPVLYQRLEHLRTGGWRKPGVTGHWYQGFDYMLLEILFFFVYVCGSVYVSKTACQLTDAGVRAFVNDLTDVGAGN